MFLGTVLSRVVRSSWPWLAATAVLIGALSWSRPVVAGSGPAVASPPGSTTYQIRPGDTLASIADRFGVTVKALMRQNGIQDPRRIYEGQVILLGSRATREGVVRTLVPGMDLLEFGRASGVDPELVARANGLLRMTGLPGGLRVVAPPGNDVVVVLPDPRIAPAPRIAAAVRYRVGLWDVLRLNPVPGAMGQRLLLPAGGGEAMSDVLQDSELPYPVVALHVSPQPVARGEVAVIRVVTAEPATCVLAYLGKTEACLDRDGAGVQWVGLVGLPALLDVGVMPVSLHLRTGDGIEVEVAVPLLVQAGRYDYERIDLPPDRQALLDPAASQGETAKIAALQTLRSPTRYWIYPFRLPLQSAVTSYYGSRRSYGYGFGSYHAGTDFDGEIGMPVTAPTPGVVVLAEPLVVRGNAIVIDHGWGVVTGYWHLAHIGVEVGQEVEAGEVIGLLGNTGLSTGAHLHWELWVNGVTVNVLSWLLPDGPAALLGVAP